MKCMYVLPTCPSCGHPYWILTAIENNGKVEQQYTCSACGKTLTSDEIKSKCIQLFNLTPHPIHIVIGEGIEIPPSGVILRLPENIESEESITIDGIDVPIVTKQLQIADLPPSETNVYYIVSLAIAQVIRRRDFLVPDELIRDSKGQVVGCRRLARII